MIIQQHLRAGFPALIVLTNEYKRAEQLLPCDDNIKFMTWDVISGVKDTRTNKIIDESMIDPVDAVKFLNQSRDTVLICHNMHLFLDSPELIQSIQNGTSRWKGLGNCLVMISPVVNLPVELNKVFTLIELELPSVEEIHEIQCDLGQTVNVKPNRKASRAGLGLTTDDVESCFSLSLVKNGFFSSKVVHEIKSQMIKKAGAGLEVWAAESMKNVGGLQNLKDFIKSRTKGFQPESNLPKPRGILIIGVPGTGKSLISKCIASVLNFPLIKFSISDMKGSLVGESEKNLRNATQTIQAFGECVCFCDEIEKSLAGHRSSGETDGGTTSSMLGHLLTFLQENTSPVFFAATANDPSKLSAEFIRRFDACYFVDVPVHSERVEILKIMNKKYGTDIPLSYVDKTNGWTGAELEKFVVASMYDGIEVAFESIIPLTITSKEQVEQVRSWARTRARRANSDDTPIKESRKIRQIK